MSERHARRAYICQDPKTKVIHERRFLLPGEAVPRCGIHGPMKPQANNKYKGRTV